MSHRFEPGDRVWAPHKTDVYVPARVTRAAAGEATELQLDDDLSRYTLAKDDVVLPLDPTSLEAVADLAYLSDLQEAPLLYALRNRCEQK